MRLLGGNPINFLFTIDFIFMVKYLEFVLIFVYFDAQDRSGFCLSVDTAKGAVQEKEGTVT